jgi:hypothetical protein
MVMCHDSHYKKGATLLEVLSNLDTIADRQPLAPVHSLASEAPRLPWYNPTLQRSNVALDTRGGMTGMTDGIDIGS